MTTYEISFKRAIRHVIAGIGDDPMRPGLIETPDRVMASWKELFSGYGQDPKDLMKVFEDGGENYDELILLKGVEFTSFCEHHLLPFSGVAHVGYVPKDNRIIGLSKLARVVDCFAKRLQVQERLTTQVADALMTHLMPLGAGCVIEASHSCVGCRGVKKPGAVMVTSCLRGAFRDDRSTRSEFLRLVGK